MQACIVYPTAIAEICSISCLFSNEKSISVHEMVKWCFNVYDGFSEKKVRRHIYLSGCN